MKNNLVNTKKRLVSMVSVMLVSAGLLAILVSSCRSSTEGDAMSAELVKRWGITSIETPERGILLPLSDSPRRITLVEDPKSGKVGEFSLVDLKTNRVILEYIDKGIFGLPELHYSSPSQEGEIGTTLADYNLDATFDVLYGVGPKGTGMYISLPSGWVKASAKDGMENGATTVDGKKYQFDVTTGKWRPTD